MQFAEKKKFSQTYDNYLGINRGYRAPSTKNFHIVLRTHRREKRRVKRHAGEVGAWECVSIKSVDFLLGHDEQATKSNIKHGNDSRSGCRGLSRMLLLGIFSIIDLPRLVWPTRWTVTRKASWAWFMNIFLGHVLSTKIARKSMMFCVDSIWDGPEDRIDSSYEITVEISKTRW